MPEDMKEIGMSIGVAVLIVKKKFPKEFENAMNEARAFEEGLRANGKSREQKL